MDMLVADQIIEQAHVETGLDHFDSESFREGLDVFIAAINRDPRPDVFRDRLHATLVKTLSDRLKVANALNERPEVLTRPVTRPVFVFGIPRTGTTLLSNLLGADPARRAMLQWELNEPVPPPTTAMLYTDPRALAALETERQMLEAYPEMGKYFRGSATFPHECVYIMAHDFRTLLWDAYGKLPAYRDWLFQTDMTGAYEYHKKFLQLHQADAPGIWSLKMPSHSLWLRTLLKIYPDARLVWTHRDPLAATASFCSLIRLSHEGMRGAVDIDWIAENCPYQASEHVNRVLAARDEIGEDRIIDVHYADMLRDPITVMRKLYKSLGDEFTPAAESGMQGWLDDNPQDKFGRHEYKFAQFGLTKEQLAPLFEHYLSRYDVEPEG